MRPFKLMTKIIFLLLLTSLSSCISEPLLLTKSAELDYHTAQRLIKNKDFARAVLFLEKFSAKYPYSQYSTDAEILRLEASYKNAEYILSETLGLRFIDAHPDHKKRVYAEYIVAMSYYKQSSSASLDQQFSYKARNSFITLEKHFPNNPYASETNNYLSILTNRVAKHEILVGKFYYDRKLFVAAANRFIYIKNEYAKADIAPESLYLLISSYIKLTQTIYAKETLTLFGQRFPKSPWYNKAQHLL